MIENIRVKNRINIVLSNRFTIISQIVSIIN